MKENVLEFLRRGLVSSIYNIQYKLKECVSSQ